MICVGTPRKSLLESCSLICTDVILEHLKRWVHVIRFSYYTCISFTCAKKKGRTVLFMRTKGALHLDNVPLSKCIELDAFSRPQLIKDLFQWAFDALDENLYIYVRNYRHVTVVHLPEIPCRLTIALVEMGCYRKLQWMGQVWLGFRQWQTLRRHNCLLLVDIGALTEAHLRCRWKYDLATDDWTFFIRCTWAWLAWGSSFGVCCPLSRYCLVRLGSPPSYQKLGVRNCPPSRRCKFHDLYSDTCFQWQ